MAAKQTRVTPRVSDPGREPRRRAERGDELPVDVAFRKIKEMMYHHQLVPGQKLVYQELARKLGMSITPVIQALNRLQLLGIVYSERNKGYYVGEADPAEARELFAAREALEVFLVPAVIRNLTDEKIAMLEAALREHITAVSAPQYRRLLLMKDLNFHLKVVECAGNKVIHTLCKMVFERIYLKYRPEYMREERIQAAADEHRTLFAALRARDAAKVKRLIRAHIRNGRDHLVSSLWKGRDFYLEL
jgi:DNA-binding GntR family transcriptional regulator